MNPIRTNKPVFFADDGEPLASGYIYVGLPGQNPRNFPKTVTFRDSGGGEFTASQPLRTNAQGQISYNGKAIIALVDGDYSLLIEDRTGTQTKSGWTPTVTNSENGGIVGEATRVGILLEDIKLFDVSPGETVLNVGKDTALDKLGAEWLVVSNTGSPADDVDLIDFANGTQGQRVNNQTYRKDILTTGLFLRDVPTSTLSLTDANAYRNVWTNVDLSTWVPAEATSAILRITLVAQYPTNTISDNISVIANARKAGTAAGSGLNTRIGESYAMTNSNDNVRASFTNEFTVPLDYGVPSSFDIFIIVNDPTAAALNTTPDLEITVVGYTINARDIV